MAVSNRPASPRRAVVADRDLDFRRRHLPDTDRALRGDLAVRKPRRGESVSPFRGWWYWHHVTGLAFGLLTLTWCPAVC